MQSAAFTLSPSLPIRNVNYNANRLRPSLRVNLSSKPIDGVNFNGGASSSFTRRSWSLPPSSSSSSFKFRPQPLLSSSSDPSPPKAASVSDSADSSDSGSLLKTLQLGSLFGFWYLFNIYFNIYNKQVCIFRDLFLKVLYFC